MEVVISGIGGDWTLKLRNTTHSLANNLLLAS